MTAWQDFLAYCYVEDGDWRLFRNYAMERLFGSLRYKATSSVILSGAKNLQRPFACAEGDCRKMLR
jgi:hypothetical protein